MNFLLWLALLSAMGKDKEPRRDSREIRAEKRLERQQSIRAERIEAERRAALTPEQRKAEDRRALCFRIGSYTVALAILAFINWQAVQFIIMIFFHHSLTNFVN